jgi:hypothetical protein
MRSIPTVLLLMLLTAPSFPSAQTSSAPSTKKSPPSTITLTGCVSGSPLATGEFTFVDRVSGSKYRLTGKRMKAYAGQQVEIVSSPDKKLTIKGGLYPSPNLAAQAGGIDPAQEAIARQPGGAIHGTETADVPEFRVGRVRAVPGACQ